MPNETLNGSLARDYLALIRDLVSEPNLEERLATLLEVNVQEILDWGSGKAAPSEKTLDKLVRIATVFELAGEMIAKGYHLDFFTEQHPLLEGRRPIDFLVTHDGMMKIIKLLERAKFGSFA